MSDPVDHPPWARRTRRAHGPAPPALRSPGVEGFRWRLRDVAGPGPGLVLVPLLIAVYAAQVFRLPNMGLDWALSAQALREGRWPALVTHMFLHGSVLHLFMNLMAFSTLQPAAMLTLGRTLKAWAAFAGLYGLSGLAGAVLYLALHPAGEVPMVGASGAICGLWGAASRLADADGRLTGLVDRQVGANLRNFTLMNLILVALVSGPQLLFGGGEAQGGIAWEGHVGGYLVGLLLAPWFQRLAGWRPRRGTSVPVV